MITAKKTLYLYVETPLHAGVGSGLSSIDLPIQRERTTQYPMIQGSGIKGKLRAAMEGDRKERTVEERITIDTLFGPPSTPADEIDRVNASDHAGALIFGDARILLFPVRSLNGVFAYTTSYDVLNRFMRDVDHGSCTLAWELPQEKQIEHTVHITKKQKSRVSSNNMVVLEEFSFTAEESSSVDDIATWIAAEGLPQTQEYAYWRDKVKDSLIILPEDDFRDFVVNATEIITRISIDRKTKTAAGTALWTEEHLPTDTLLYVPVYATNSRRNGSTMQAKDILQKVTSLEDNQEGYIQLGGDETVGRGIVRMQWSSK